MFTTNGAFGVLLDAILDGFPTLSYKKGVKIVNETTDCGREGRGVAGHFCTWSNGLESCRSRFFWKSQNMGGMLQPIKSLQLFVAVQCRGDQRGSFNTVQVMIWIIYSK